MGTNLTGRSHDNGFPTVSWSDTTQLQNPQLYHITGADPGFSLEERGAVQHIGAMGKNGEGKEMQDLWECGVGVGADTM